MKTNITKRKINISLNYNKEKVNDSQTLSFIITLEEVISAIFDRSFSKFGTLIVALLDAGLVAISVKIRQS